MSDNKPNNPVKTEPSSSLGHDAWRRLRRNRLAMLGGAFLIFMILLSLTTPWLTRHVVVDENIAAYNQQDRRLGATPPSKANWLGTDERGRDALTRILYGGRISLMIGLVGTAVSVFIGVLYGALAGYLGGRIDALMMRLVDILYALPFTIFVILLMVFFGRNILLLFVAIGAVEWLTMARIVRAEVRSLKHQAFIEAAVLLGYSRTRIILRHILPTHWGRLLSTPH